MQRKIIALLFLAGSLQAQVVMGGHATLGGNTVVTSPGALPPPPPVATVLARMYGGVYNSSSPSWPPRDLAGAAMQQGTCRVWDSGAKIGQIMTVSGPVGSHTYSFNWTPLDNIIQRCKQTAGFSGAPNAPMKVIYTLGDTPAGAALAGTAPACLPPDTTNSCRAYDDNTQGAASETDKTMLTFLANLLSHVASLGIVLDGIELQNEWDDQGFQCWNGSACGGGTNPSSANNITAVMNLAMIQRGWDLRAELNCKSPTTKIWSPSSHVATVQPGNIFDNLLNASTTVHALTGGVNGYPAGCPNLTSQVVFGWQVVDIITIHPDGNGTADTPESFITSNTALECERTAGCTSTTGNSHSGTAYTHLIGIPKSADEFGIRSGMCTTADCLEADATRRFIYCAWFSYQDCDWYQIDGKGSFTSLIGQLAGNGFDQLALWTIGGATATFNPPTGTVYQEQFLNAANVLQLLIYDTAATDSNGGYTCNNTIGGAHCTSVAVPSAYTFYQSLDGVVHTITSHTVWVGGKPVCVTTNPSGC